MAAASAIAAAAADAAAVAIAAADADETFELAVAKDIRFNAAHFVAHGDTRERLHGHNFTIGLRVRGALQADGYVIDFGVLKREARALCKTLNERFLVPVDSPCIEITHGEELPQVDMVCADGTRFSFPRGDCALLPIAHATSEELARWFWASLVERIGLEELRGRGATWMEVALAEAPLQEARYSRSL